MCAFLISSLHESEWLDSPLDSFTLGQRASGVHWVGDWVGFRTGVNLVAIIYLFILLFIICLTALSVAQIRAMVSSWRMICGSTPSRLVIDFNTQCACAILFSVACPALHYFSSLSHKW